MPRSRPDYIVSSADVPETLGSYPASDEPLAYGRPIGKHAGLNRIGVHIERLPSGHRLSYPHAEENEEEFVYVLEGDVEAWIDGDVHRMTKGDFAAFPCGTGISHTFVNESEREVLLLVGGEASKGDSKIFYPLNPERRAQLSPSQWWNDVPPRPLGSHDGKPRRGR